MSDPSPPRLLPMLAGGSGLPADPSAHQMEPKFDGAGVRCVAIPTDVADALAVEDAATRIEDTLGHIDVWVNSAVSRASSACTAGWWRERSRAWPC